MSRATLYKGPVPSRFGGATSSVLETTMVPGNPDAYDFSGTIGLLNAKIFAGGPIVKNKLSFAVAARTSYVDLFLKMIPKYRHTVMNFFDVNAKVRYIADSSNIVDFSFFAARDGRHATSIWSFGVFNAYSHYSPFVIYFEDDLDKPSGTRAVQQSLFGIIPSVSYTIKF